MRYLRCQFKNLYAIEKNIVPSVYTICHTNVLQSKSIHSSCKLFELRHEPNRKYYSAKPAESSDLEQYLNEHKITVIGDDIPSPWLDINVCEFPSYIKDYLSRKRFDKPTVIQSNAWPIATSGRNFVGIAQTGTGKTLAFILPAVMHIKEKEHSRGKGPIVLVLAPTRELARQIDNVTRDFKRLLNINCVCIYGGANRNRQAQQLEEGVDLVIATPGRLNDFLTSKTTSLCRCTYVVLDEADRMLDMGFEPQIRQILEEIPKERQILMFSATWPKEVQHLAKEFLGKFVQVNVGSTELVANHNIKQHIHVCEQDEKFPKFKSIMKDIYKEGFEKILVFTNTKRFVDNIVMTLKNSGWAVEGIHGDKTQWQRDNIIRKFKTGEASVLVATDVAARGLDVRGITHVVNFDFPQTSEDYIHRIGRTGRSENTGASHTILTSDDGRLASEIIAVLQEAKQEVPEELDQLARSYVLNKARERKSKPYAKKYHHSPWRSSRMY